MGLLLIKKVCGTSKLINEVVRNYFANQLLTYDPNQALPVSAFSLGILPEALPTINCFQALDYLWVVILLSHTSSTGDVDIANTAR